MKYAKRSCGPADILAAAEQLNAAKVAVNDALNHLNGKVNVGLLDNYIKTANKLFEMSVSLEDDFAELCVLNGYTDRARSVPLFGDNENLKKAREWLNQVQGS